MAASGTGVSHASDRPAHCAYHQLKVTAGDGGAATGHYGFPLRFRNHSHHACTIRAYPGAAGLNKHGKQVEQAKRTKNGYIGGVPSGDPIPTVTLHHGQVASALIEGSDVGTKHHPHCADLRGLLVTPPNDHKSVHITDAPPGCQLQIHPVVRGKSGTESD